MNKPLAKADTATTALPHTSIASALVAAQQVMEGAKKSSKNPHFKKNYADLSSVFDACLPALNANGIAVIQPTIDCDDGRFVETILIHGETGQELKCRVPLIVQKNDMQGYGSAVTYARRYGLMSMAGIAPEDDDGHAAAKAAPRKEPQKTGPTSGQIAEARVYLLDSESLDDLKERWGKLPGPLKAHSEVADAKDAAKGNLTPTTIPGNDSIPYEGPTQ